MLSVAVSFVFVLSATETPLDPNSAVPTYRNQPVVQENVEDMRVAYPVGVENNPFYYSLQVLTPADKDNAVIEIMFMQSVSQEIENFARSIEQTWNNGNYEEALNMLSQLNAMQGVEGNAVVGISWRTPKPAPLSEWGNDVLISTRDSVFVLAMDHDLTTHNLFAMIGFTGDGMGSKYTANFSSNGGQTWSETYALGGFQYVMNDLDACCVGNHFYVAYSGGATASANTMAWLKRFHIATGQADTMPNGGSTFNIFNTTEIMDIDISANHEQFNNRLYFYCIDDAGTIHNFWNDPANVTWTGIATNINDAQQGLDTDWNVNYTTYSSIMSYINNADQVKLYGRNSTTWDNLYTYGILNTPFDDWTTAIGGHNDTLFSAFSYDGSTMQVRYLVQYGGGSWFFGFLAPDTTVSNWCADVTLRGSGGTHGVYRGPNVNEAYYRNRGYAGAWSTPVQYNDLSASGECRPQIEFVGNGNYGVLYRRPIANGGTCYYDRSDWTTGIVEHKVDDVFGSFINLAPNPARDLTRLSFVTQTQGIVRVVLYDVAGRLVHNLMEGSISAGEHSVNIEGRNLAAGIYFVRVETPDGVGTKTMTIVR
jgi:hypothetical protein